MEDNIVAGFKGNKFMLVDYVNDNEQILCDFESYYDNLTPFPIEEQKINFNNLIDVILKSNFTDSQKSIVITTAALLCNVLAKQNYEKKITHFGDCNFNDIYQFFTIKYRQDNQYVQCKNLNDDISDTDIMLYACDSQAEIESFIENHTWRLNKEVQIIFYGKLEDANPKYLSQLEYFHIGDGLAIVKGKLNLGKKYLTSLEAQIYNKIMDEANNFYVLLDKINKDISINELRNNKRYMEYESQICEAIIYADELEMKICLNEKILYNKGLKNEINEVKDALLDISYILDNNPSDLDYFLQYLNEKKKRFIKCLDNHFKNCREEDIWM